jgi:hypothetical protein
MRLRPRAPPAGRHPRRNGPSRPSEAQKPLLLSTNKAFADWGQVFPRAACVVTLVDRLVHRAEVIEIEAESYRLKEAKELNATRTKQRRTKKH